MSLGEGFLEVENPAVVQVDVDLHRVRRCRGQFFDLFVVNHFHFFRELEDPRITDLFLGELIDKSVPLQEGDRAYVGVAELGGYTLVMESASTEYLWVMDVVWATTFAISSGLISGLSSRNFRSAPMVVCLLRQVE